MPGEAGFAPRSYGMTLRFATKSGQTEVAMTNNILTTALMIPLLAGVIHSGQASTKQALLMAMGANGKQMVTYQWKQKITVVRKGTPMDPMIEEIRFDATGQPQRVTLVKPEEKRMGPLAGKKGGRNQGIGAGSDAVGPPVREPATAQSSHPERRDLGRSRPPSRPGASRDPSAWTR